MGLAIGNEAPPLKADKQGVIRVAGTRVTLDTLVGYYKQGLTIEDLSRNFPTVQLADILSTVAYYLHHKDEVESYLKEQDERGRKVQAEIEAKSPRDEGLRERLLARRAKKNAG